MLLHIFYGGQRKAKLSQIGRNEAHKYAQLETRVKVHSTFLADMPSTDTIKWVQMMELMQRVEEKCDQSRENIGQIMFRVWPCTLH